MVFQFEGVKLFPSITQSMPGSEHRISHTGKLQGGESDGGFGMDRWKKSFIPGQQGLHLFLSLMFHISEMRGKR